MITKEQFDNAVTGRDNLSVYSEAHVPVIDTTIPISIGLDSGFQTISPRQLKCLNDFLSLSPDLLPQIKEALFAHMTEYDQLYTEEGNYPYSTSSETYAVSTPSLLLLEDENHRYAEYPVLVFSPEWDREHGAEIWYYDGRFGYR